ncbi:response regulator [Pseudomonas lopnurensis]|uniref:response regulator n=1 Tax=Pseudomonas lopnurensis TaxID=1477517 RepID=UPI001879B7CC|nr:response regulator [Pseudomonas lopnurensis]MBE7373904.1 response regulator [Pseudomonas lopnurensis]
MNNKQMSERYDTETNDKDAASSANAPLTVLLVEDDPIVRVIVHSMLDELGHTCIEVKSAERALDILATNASIDLVVTDYSMQALTGGQLIEIIKHIYPQVSTILATGNPTNATGMDVTVLHKPFFQEHLDRAIKETMAHNGL